MNIFHLSLITFLLMVIISAKPMYIIEQRCHQPLENNCQLDPRTMALWCDETNLTSIPSPEDLRRMFTFEGPPDKAALLYFGRSCVMEIDGDALAKYSRTKMLNLSENLLKKLDGDEFRGLKLQILILSKNKIRSVGYRTFSGLNNLLHLELDNNELDELNSNIFASLVSLQLLNLSRNVIKSLPTKIFWNLENLTELDLSGNQLTFFLANSLKNLKKLRILNLSNNQLTYFDSKHIFLAPHDLKELYLNNNSISCFDKDAFADENLSVLNFENNPLETPERRWFSSLTQKSNSDTMSNTIIFSSNGSWVCDCRVFAYKVMLEVLNDPMLLQRLDVVCYNPLPLRGKKLSSVDWNEIQCVKPVSSECIKTKIPETEDVTKILPSTTKTSFITTTIPITTTPLDYNNLPDPAKIIQPPTIQPTVYPGTNASNTLDAISQKTTISTDHPQDSNDLLHLLIIILSIILAILLCIVAICFARSQKKRRLLKKEQTIHRDSRLDDVDDFSNHESDVSENFEERGCGSGSSEVESRPNITNPEGDETRVKIVRSSIDVATNSGEVAINSEDVAPNSEDNESHVYQSVPPEQNTANTVPFTHQGQTIYHVAPQPIIQPIPIVQQPLLQYVPVPVSPSNIYTSYNVAQPINPGLLQPGVQAGYMNANTLFHTQELVSSCSNKNNINNNYNNNNRVA